MICEPVLQGAGGMYVYDPDCLRRLRELCDEHDLLLIFDEIATGFGRTGTLFAAEHAGVVPDIMCVGKALTGGYLTLAATLCTTNVAAGHRRQRLRRPHARTDVHGQPARLRRRDRQPRPARPSATGRPTYAGSRQGCAQASSPRPSSTESRDVRVIGAVGVIQLDHPVDVVTASRAAAERGVWIRPFRDLVYTMPPYVIDDDDLADDLRRRCSQRRRSDEPRRLARRPA